MICHCSEEQLQQLALAAVDYTFLEEEGERAALRQRMERALELERVDAGSGSAFCLFRGCGAAEDANGLPN